MHGEHGWAYIRGRNSNNQLLMGLSNDLISIWFYEKNENWKMIFKMKMIFYKTEVVNLILKCFLND